MATKLNFCKTLVKGAIILTSPRQIQQGWASLLRFIIASRCEALLRSRGQRAYGMRELLIPLWIWGDLGGEHPLGGWGWEGSAFALSSPPPQRRPSPCSHSVVPGVLWVQRSAEHHSQPFGRWERTGWCVLPEALGIPSLCFWPTWAASISPEKAPPRTSQPLPGVPVFMACAFCCRSLLGKASLGLGWVWLLGDARSRQRANATFATEGNRALVLSRTFADLVFLRGNAPKLSYPWILEMLSGLRSHHSGIDWIPSQRTSLC